ncbi:hypothetical protein MAPG_07061 [Magnaporthiopsis poae ATCC 64411]|uniref:lytic cellulose monooxygenase (C4-dehydrogenating) n=1 Tax=Magnaporthiopsis poae (strain ATCC 64411 / 73-15) TaxID=644358 RepID=A0A0C4E3P6_MAGP6|nr:hypothetical protein MAPG_07061 [Magnaporthiopsis poae ATCC 64411]
MAGRLDRGSSSFVCTSSRAPAASNLSHFDRAPGIMKATALLLALTAAAAEAHYVFPNIAVGGQRTSDWQAMTCYELSPGCAAPLTVNVTAGGTVAYTAKSGISHSGPLSAWLGFVPAGKTAATWDGSGSRWVKIFQDKPSIRVTGGSGSEPTGKMVAIPGVYRPNDPGLVVNIYYPVPTNYKGPGPDPLRC